MPKITQLVNDRARPEKSQSNTRAIAVRDEGPTACKHGVEKMEKEVGELLNAKRSRTWSPVKRLGPYSWKPLGKSCPELPRPGKTQRGPLGPMDIWGRDKSHLQPQPVHCDKHISANIFTQIRRHTSHCLFRPPHLFPVSPGMRGHSCLGSS